MRSTTAFPRARRASANPEKLRTETSFEAWKKRYSGFEALMEAEDLIVRERVPVTRCYGYVTFGEAGEVDCWLEDIPTEDLGARFELVATQSGLALGCPPGTSPIKFWFHHLFLHLSAIESNHLRMFSGTVGVIERVFGACATYCVRLEQLALERDADIPARFAETAESQPSITSEMSESEKPAKVPLGPAKDPEKSRREIVDQFLKACNQEAGIGSRVTRKSIWRLAGHRHARQFEYWQEESPKATGEDNRNFGRLLGLSPSDFIALLKKSGVLPSNS